MHRAPPIASPFIHTKGHKMKQMSEAAFLQQMLIDGATNQYFLCSGVKLVGVLAGFDHKALFVRRPLAQGGGVQMVYKLNLSTVCPGVAKHSNRNHSQLTDDVVSV
jgi:sRNA-binding regulator protein Hfq